jgi:ATP-dependent helicase HrpB
MTDLPIEDILPALKNVLGSGSSAVLQAPPGAGKTTRVPLALLDEPWLADSAIVMLEPRRLAARAAAHRMASMLGEKVGGTVGYRMRMDTKVGAGTRIVVVTEGVLTRMLQSDPALEGVGLVIFDEFHERNLQADLGLALSLQSRSLLRNELRLLVMSATLDGKGVAALLEDAPIITSVGRSHPVETRYRQRSHDERIEPAVIAAVLDSLANEKGDILVFLPGAAEIGRVERSLGEAELPRNVTIAPLYGNLPQEAQDRAIEPSTEGMRKVVLATSIAETSLTIEGVRIVIDSGVMRVPRFSPRSGMTRLETVRVSQASADQRRGRAGRLGPGICYRLWSEHDHLIPHGSPEILEADLAPLALDLAEWGIADPSELSWLDSPPEGAFSQARELLTELGALDAAGGITPHGRRMASLSLHPRLSHMILKADPLGLGGLACEIAALLAERDIFRSDGRKLDADLRLRLEALRDMKHGERSDHPYLRGHQLDRTASRRVLAEADHWKRRLKISGGDEEIEACGLLLAFAYPDRIAQARPGQPGRFLLRNGQGAFFSEHQLLSETSWLIVAELDGQRRESRIFLAAPVTLEQIEEQYAGQIQREKLITWDGEARGVRARERERLGAILLRDAPLHDPDPEAVAEAVIEGIEQEGVEILPWSKGARAVQQRVIFIHRIDPSWPDLSDEALGGTLRDWLAPHLQGMRSREDLQSLDLASILQGMLSWEKRSALENLAPTHLTVPSGSRIPIDYSNPEIPVVAVRLQEMFGLTETPRIARGMVPLTLHLLSPAGRPVQVTRDLANFWRSTYFEVKKDLKGRYPKHYWPDDPMQGVPTNRVRPRG